jgi:hypothetical protein
VPYPTLRKALLAGTPLPTSWAIDAVAPVRNGVRHYQTLTPDHIMILAPGVPVTAGPTAGLDRGVGIFAPDPNPTSTQHPYHTEGPPMTRNEFDDAHAASHAAAAASQATGHEDAMRHAYAAANHAHEERCATAARHHLKAADAHEDAAMAAHDGGDHAAADQHRIAASLHRVASRAHRPTENRLEPAGDDPLPLPSLWNRKEGGSNFDVSGSGRFADATVAGGWEGRGFRDLTHEHEERQEDEAGTFYGAEAPRWDSSPDWMDAAGGGGAAQAEGQGDVYTAPPRHITSATELLPADDPLVPPGEEPTTEEWDGAEDIDAADVRAGGAALRGRPNRRGEDGRGIASLRRGSYMLGQEVDDHLRANSFHSAARQRHLARLLPYSDAWRASIYNADTDDDDCLPLPASLPSCPR